MAKLSPELLGQYLDGELPTSETDRIRSMLDASDDEKRTVEEWAKIGSMLRVMDEETTSDASFEGLSEKVLAEIKTTRTSLPFSEKTKAWLSEFFEYRKTVWIPTVAAVGALCLALLALPAANPAPFQNEVSQGSGIVLHSATTPKGSRITAVDFGTQSGMQYAVDDGTGVTVGVVWIVDKQ